MEALCTVVFGGRPYEVVVSYNAGQFVAGVKELIVDELKSSYNGFDSVKAGYLTLKTLDGDVIVQDIMPDGNDFLAELVVPMSYFEPPRKRLKLPLRRIEVELTRLGEMKDSECFVDVSGLHHAAIARKECDRKRFFMRSASLELLNKLRGDFRGLRIFGAPGVGKSSLVWMWACDEFLTNKKKVLWVHVMMHFLPEFVLMSDGEVFKVFDADADYIKVSDADIIVVDGVVEANAQEFSQVLFLWEGYRRHRKCVQVASTQLRLNNQDEAIMKILHYEMPPWTLQEYIAACRDGEFYNEVSCMFEGLRSGVANEDVASWTGEDREDLIAEKLYYAGGSARWMFGYTTKQVERMIIEEFRRFGGKSPYLWVGYPVAKDRGYWDFCVSQYFAREKLSFGGEAEIKMAYTSATCLRNPAFLGWVIDMDFIQYLHDCTRTKSPARVWTLAADRKVNKQSWGVPGILDFELDTIGSVKESILRHFWLRPRKWNLGGYDLACLLNVDGQSILRFVQIAAAHDHSLKLKYFRDLAIKINQIIPEIELIAIEIVMLAPDKGTASEFKIALSKVSNPGALSHWFCGDSEEHWKQGKEEEQVRVFWFESRG